MGWLNSCLASGGEEFLDAGMPEALNHVYSVARHYSAVKWLPENGNPESSEPLPQGDKNFAVAGVSDRDSKGKHADGGIGYQACDTILAENRACLR